MMPAASAKPESMQLFITEAQYFVQGSNIRLKQKSKSGDVTTISEAAPSFLYKTYDGKLCCPVVVGNT